MAFIKSRLELRFTDSIMILDHGGLPPLPPIDEPGESGDWQPDPVTRFRVRLSAICCAGFAGGSFALTMLGIAAASNPDMMSVTGGPLSARQKMLIQIDCGEPGKAPDQPRYWNWLCPYKPQPKP